MFPLPPKHISVHILVWERNVWIGVVHLIDTVGVSACYNLQCCYSLVPFSLWADLDYLCDKITIS